ncbi:MAG: methyltransferase domain-containing protein [Candidatus Lokiarchaeota archaeon]|nr:methyltransferase domain-containing protein [Candidatus Lokiarchaeota archaeon]
MLVWYIFLGILVIVLIILLIFGLPRKHIERQPSLEGIESKEVVNGFEKMAKTPPFKLFRHKIVSKIRDMNPTGTIVDLGCGSGNLIVKIAKDIKDVELIGVDISSEMLQRAKKRAEKQNLDSHIKFKTGSADSLPFSDNSINMIVSSLSLHHWEDPLKSLKEINRVLKNDGKLLLFDFRRDARRFFYVLLIFATRVVVPKALKEINEPLGSLKAGYTLREINEILESSPFHEFNIEPYLAWLFITVR